MDPIASLSTFFKAFLKGFSNFNSKYSKLKPIVNTQNGHVAFCAPRKYSCSRNFLHHFQSVISIFRQDKGAFSQKQH